MKYTKHRKNKCHKKSRKLYKKCQKSRRRKKTRKKRGGRRRKRSRKGGEGETEEEKREKSKHLKKLWEEKRKDAYRQSEIQAKYIEGLKNGPTYIPTKPSKKKLSWGQTSCKSNKDCKKGEICAGRLSGFSQKYDELKAKEKEEGLCVKPTQVDPKELHYDNKNQKYIDTLSDLPNFDGWYYDNNHDMYVQFDKRIGKIIRQQFKHPDQTNVNRFVRSVQRKFTRAKDKMKKGSGKRRSKKRKR